MGKKFSWKMMLGTILAGGLYGIIGELIYKPLNGLIPSPVLTIIYFMGMFFFISLAVHLISKLAYSQQNGKVYMKVWVIALLLMLVLSGVFELIYDLIKEGGGIKNSKSYIFAVDISGSMEQTDPMGTRYDAIDRVLDSKADKFEYAVYTFSDPEKITLVRDMAPKSEGKPNFQNENWGSTAIVETFQRIADDIDSGVMKADGNTRVILLTDGYPNSESGIMAQLNRFKTMGIPISTVGLVDSDDNFMSMVANATGGNYVKADTLDRLEGAMEEAVVENKAYRNLLGFRSDLYLNWLLAILRILFVGILGIVMAVGKTGICEKFVNTTSVLVSSCIGGILAGICIEIGMNGLGINQTVMRIIAAVLMAFTCLREDLFFNQLQNNRERNSMTGWNF